MPPSVAFGQHAMNVAVNLNAELHFGVALGLPFPDAFPDAANHGSVLYTGAEKWQHIESEAAFKIQSALVHEFDEARLLLEAEVLEIELCLADIARNPMRAGVWTLATARHVLIPCPADHFLVARAIAVSVFELRTAGVGHVDLVVLVRRSQQDVAGLKPLHEGFGIEATAVMATVI